MGELSQRPARSPGVGVEIYGVNHIGNYQRWNAMILVHVLKGEVLKPTLKHTAAIIKKARRLRENVNIPRPAQAPIPLQTIRRDFKKVPTHAPGDVPVISLSEQENQPVHRMSVRSTLASTSFRRSDPGGQLST